DSVSMEGLASVTATLQEGVNPNAALSDVRSRVEAARRTLPSEVSAPVVACGGPPRRGSGQDRKSTRLNSSHVAISHAVFCVKKKRQLCGSRIGSLSIGRGRARSQ